MQAGLPCATDNHNQEGSTRHTKLSQAPTCCPHGVGGDESTGAVRSRVRAHTTPFRQTRSTRTGSQYRFTELHVYCNHRW